MGVKARITKFAVTSISPVLADVSLVLPVDGDVLLELTLINE